MPTLLRSLINLDVHGVVDSVAACWSLLGESNVFSPLVCLQNRHWLKNSAPSFGFSLIGISDIQKSNRLSWHLEASEPRDVKLKTAS